MSVCSHRTTTDDIDLTFEALAEHGARIDGARRSTDDPSSPAFDS
jgi:hypothetical protein